MSEADDANDGAGLGWRLGREALAFSSGQLAADLSVRLGPSPWTSLDSNLTLIGSWLYTAGVEDLLFELLSSLGGVDMMLLENEPDNNTSRIMR